MKSFMEWLHNVNENMFQGAGVYIMTPRGRETYSVPKLAEWASKNSKPTTVTIDWLKNNITNSSGSGYSSLFDLPEKGTDEYTRTMNANTSYPIIIVKEAGETWIVDGNHRVMKARLTGQNQLPAYILDAAAIPPPNELY